MNSSATRDSGFTLLELLIAMTVLSVLIALAVGGIRFGARVWERGDDRLRIISELETTQAVVRRSLSQALPFDPIRERRTTGEANQGKPFQGTSRDIRFFATSPARPLLDACYQLSLEARSAGPTSHLVLTIGRAAPGTGRRGGDGRETVLIEGAQDIAFAYFGAEKEDDEVGWTERWLDSQGLPLLVSVRVSFPPGDPRIWPELIVAPRIQLSAD
jgi:general secretion pathway protein J